MNESAEDQIKEYKLFSNNLFPIAGVEFWLQPPFFRYHAYNMQIDDIMFSNFNCWRYNNAVGSRAYSSLTCDR